MSEIMYGCSNNTFCDMHEESPIDYSYHLEKFSLKMPIFNVAYARKSEFVATGFFKLVFRFAQCTAISS